MTGMGTTLAVVGAYLLAGEIASQPVLGDAFKGYERVMRPWVERVQKTPPGVPRVANPTSRVGVTLLQAAMRIAGTPVVGGVASRLGAGITPGGTLPAERNSRPLTRSPATNAPKCRGATNPSAAAGSDTQARLSAASRLARLDGLRRLSCEAHVS